MYYLLIIGKAVTALPSANTNNNNYQGIKVNDDCQFKAIMYDRRTSSSYQQGIPSVSIDSSLVGSLSEKVYYYMLDDYQT